MRVLVTRPEPEALITSGQLERAGHEALVSPLLTITGTGVAVSRGDHRGIIVTSARIFDHISGASLSALQDLPTVAVGEKTAERACAAGLTIAAIAPDAESLKRQILASSMRGPWLYLAGRERRPDLERALVDAGQAVTAIDVYEVRAVEALPAPVREALAVRRLDAVLHFSPRSAGVFVELAERAGLLIEAGLLRHIAISDAAAGELRGVFSRVEVAERPESAAMLALLDHPGCV